MKILALESSAKTAGAALLDGDRLISELYADTGLTHSETLMPMCQSVLNQSVLAVRDIDVIAVSAGPGSFTGLRIAIAAAKGLGLAADIPCAPVSTLLALAHNIPLCDGIVCPVMDARRNQVYNAFFEYDGGDNPKRLSPDRAISIEELKKELKKFNKKIIFLGDGAELCYNHLRDSIKCEMAPPALRYQRASSVAYAAKEVLPVRADELRAVYLRLPQAERERLEKLRGDY